MVDGRISDPASGSNGKLATGHTASLAPHRSQHPPQQHMVSSSPDALPNRHDLDDEECGSEESEVRALGLMVTQPVSISSAAAGLAPEAPEGIIVGQQHPRMSTVKGSDGVSNTEEDEPPPADIDVEAAPLLGTTKDERQYLSKTNPRLFMLIFLSILLAMFIAIFDGTIMASSHPVITSYFHSSNSASWLSTAFLLTSTALQPLTGRLSDTIGRKPPYIVTMAMFAAATIWCALADSIESLILARAFCGLGAGGMMSMGNIIISDLVPIERRGVYQSYINVIFGLAAASGAALGGLMADTLGWRWEFGVQIPAILICLAVAIALVPPDLGIQGNRETLKEAMRSFDGKGSILLTASTTFLILALNLGGNILPWSHPLIITSFAIVAGCFPSCLWVESKAQRPIMPLYLLHSSPRANIIFSNFLGAFIWSAVFFNVPLYFQAVLLTSATESGLRLIVPQITGASVGIATGLLITWSKRLKWPLVTGTVLTLAGSIALCSLSRDWPSWAYLLVLVPGAAGGGFLFPGGFLAVLAASAQAEQAVVSSTLGLWRALGSVMGVACSSLVLQNSLMMYLAHYITEDGHEAGWKNAVIARVRESVEEVGKFEGVVLEQIIQSYEAALRMTFLSFVGVALVCFCLVLPIRLERLAARK